MGELFNAWGKLKKEKKANNRASSPNILKENGISFTSHNLGAHLIVKHNNFVVDFWPGTGKYNVRGSPKYKRGVYNLLRDIK